MQNNDTARAAHKRANLPHIANLLLRSFPLFARIESTHGIKQRHAATHHNTKSLQSCKNVMTQLMCMTPNLCDIVAIASESFSSPSFFNSVFSLPQFGTVGVRHHGPEENQQERQHLGRRESDGGTFQHQDPGHQDKACVIDALLFAVLDVANLSLLIIRAFPQPR